MRLNGLQIERTAAQLVAKVIPEDHPLAAQLKSVFGDHTYFVDRNGLNILEPAEVRGMAAVVNLATG